MSPYRSTAYRLYHFEAGRIVAVEELDCASDDAAREQASRMQLWPHVELWCGDRLVFGRGSTTDTCH